MCQGLASSLVETSQQPVLPAVSAYEYLVFSAQQEEVDEILMVLVVR